MITGYFDESGHSADTDFFSLAALVASDDDWALFDERWRKALARHEAPWLHMREFAHFVGVFAGWSEADRRSLLADCVAAINSIHAIVVGVAISVDEFMKLDPKMISVLIDPFYCCFREVVRGVARMADLEPGGTRVRMIFSQQDEFKSTARGMWNRMAQVIDVRDRMGSLEFEDMRTTPALQAADLFAYEYRHFYHLQKNRPELNPRWAFKEIIGHQCKAYNARMLKYLPKWYLELQAAGVHDGAMQTIWRNPDTFFPFLNDLFSQV